MKRLFTGWLLLAVSLCLSRQAAGQELPSLGSVQIPEAYTYSPDSLALYLDVHYPTEEAKLQALYIWIAENMTYNVYPIFEKSDTEEAEELRRTLKTRDGVCRHFAKLFRAVGERMDLPVYVVEGYVKSSTGSLMADLHAWCVAKVDGKWYGYDPTFGMGHTSNQKFVSRPSMKYCRMDPDVAIRTYMPCDPIWQLLERPRSYQSFDDGVAEDPASRPYFNFNDSISLYLSQTPLQRLLGVNRRMAANGRSNRLTDYYRQVNDANISYYRETEVYSIFKLALKQYNKAFDRYGDLNLYRLNHFQPKKTPAEVERQIGQVRQYTQAADSIIRTAVVPNASPYVAAVNNLKGSIEELKGMTGLLEELLEGAMKEQPTPGRRRKG